MQTVIRTSRRLKAFLYEAAQNFESFQILKSDIKKSKTYIRLMSFSRPMQWYHSHADPIWPDGTFTHFFSFSLNRQYCRLVEDTGRMRSLFFTNSIKDNIAGWWRTQGACAAFSHHLGPRRLSDKTCRTRYRSDHYKHK